MTKIRKADLNDCQLIHDMAWRVFPDTYKDILSKEQNDYMMEWMYSLDSLRKQMTVEKHVYLLAYDGVDYIGYVSVQPQDKGLWHLQKIYVMPEYQNSGYGKLLFRAATDYIKSTAGEHCVVELNVNRNNKALKFYEHMGMTKVRQGDFEIGNGYYMNDYIMSMTL